MIFGLMNPLLYFPKLVFKVLGPLGDYNIIFYLHDILILGDDWPDPGQWFILFLEALEKAINLKKCRFLKTKASYSGHEIRALGIQAGTNELQAILGFRTR